MFVKELLIALLVVALVGLIAGILLALASRFLGVEEDETVQKARACLPGANCGACGYAGCDDYAAAVASGEAETNLCIPGGNDTAAQLAALMGVEAGKTTPKVAAVHCNGTCEAVTCKFHYEGISTCKAASMIYGGPESCRFGCLDCGDCAAVCPVNAICIMDGVARIDSRTCIGCGKCVKTCPKKIISLIPKLANPVVLCSNTDKGVLARKACKNACIGCKKCEKACLSDAIKVENNLARVDYEKCTACGACVAACPTGCLKIAVPEDGGIA